MLSPTCLSCAMCVEPSFLVILCLLQLIFSFSVYIPPVRMSLKHECYGIITDFVRYKNGIVLTMFLNVLVSKIHTELFTEEFKIVQTIKKLRS